MVAPMNPTEESDMTTQHTPQFSTGDQVLVGSNRRPARILEVREHGTWASYNVQYDEVGPYELPTDWWAEEWLTAARCDHRSEYGLGCARTAGHDGAHWVTADPDAARADLTRQGLAR